MSIEATEVIVAICLIPVGLLICMGLAAIFDSVRHAIGRGKERRICDLFSQMDYWWNNKHSPSVISDIEAGVDRLGRRITDVSHRLDAMHEDWVKQPSTATCHICGKRDFMDNLADVGWMGDDEDFIYSDGFRFAHPDCAGITRSDDGKGWHKCKCKGKK